MENVDQPTLGKPFFTPERARGRAFLAVGTSQARTPSISILSREGNPRGGR